MTIARGDAEHGAWTTVTDLVRNFGDACRVLVPHLDRALIPWADGQQYDNCDRITEALFESLVLEPCRFQASETEPTRFKPARYGFTPSGETAFVRLVRDEEGECRFVQLVSVAGPFDQCEGASSGGDVVVPIEQATFSFVFVDADGVRREISEIDLRAG